MPTFVMLTSLEHGALSSPRTLEDLEGAIKSQIASQCPSVKWLANYAVLGPYDYLDTFEAPDVETAVKVSTIIRTFGHAHTEVWSATPWSRFKELIRDIPARARA